MTSKKKEKPTNVSIRLTTEEYNQMIELIDYFQDKSVAEISKNDFFRFFVVKLHEIKEKDEKKMRRAMKLFGIDHDFSLKQVL